MNSHLFTQLTLCLVVIAASVCDARSEEAKRPNILFILTDDQGYGDLGRHGHPLLKE